MIKTSGSPHSTSADLIVQTQLTTPPRPVAPPTPPSVTPELRLNQLVAEYLKFVWRITRRLGVPPSSVDDAVQQVFVVAATKIDHIEDGRERSFLFGTALRIAKELRRKNGDGREVHDEEAAARAPDASKPPDELTDELHRRLLLDSILAKMPDDMRSVFVMYELEEFTSVEIAGTLGVPVGTVASRLRRARELFHTEAANVRARYGFSEDT